MTASRRLVPVLATAVLAISAVPARAQSGAGDDQYTDPFGGGSTKAPKTSKTPSSTPKRQGSGTQNQPSLSTQPPVSSPSSSAPTATAPSATGELPRTGFEVPGVALLGAGLLATGIGLRLRTVDESVF